MHSFMSTLSFIQQVLNYAPNAIQIVQVLFSFVCVCVSSVAIAPAHRRERIVGVLVDLSSSIVWII